MAVLEEIVGTFPPITRTRALIINPSVPSLKVPDGTIETSAWVVFSEGYCIHPTFYGPR